jgi:hypothetical protein
MEVAENFELPDKCVNCGVQRTIMVERANVLESITISEGIALSLVGGSTSRLLEDLKRSAMNPEQFDKLTQEMRDQVGHDLDLKDNIVKGLEEDSVANSEACEGVIWAKATYRDIGYVIGVCTSKLLYDEGQTDVIPSVVWTHKLGE